MEINRTQDRGGPQPVQSEPNPGTTSLPCTSNKKKGWRARVWVRHPFFSLHGSGHVSNVSPELTPVHLRLIQILGKQILGPPAQGVPVVVLLGEP